MQPEPASRDRWLALAILAGLLALAYLLLVHPWWTVPLLETNARIEALRERDLRARMELAQAPEVRKRLDAARAAAGSAPGFMAEANVQLATSALVQRLEQAVLQASPGNRSCAISNRQPMNDTRAERFPRATVQVRLTCGNPELAAVLHSLESGSPRLFVDNLNVLAQRYQFSGNQGSGGGVDASFDLSGYLQPVAGTGTTDAR
ncbi:general secretion pathway protein GspM [Luteimonas viscosa]|uniref:General secretion pathway protein GspM n=1 Tax=Luteimonas viscosa TaxID=1132694 RepID=A0A5D4XEA9_9GAMM|nr:type II secretion system protein GspM [Luteimonas viscosa]TYT22978.1 general secretion pathway protein GspM [Luteimonas viscosa]